MSIYHIVPINDIEDHDDTGTTCKCEPSVIFEEDGDIIVIHHSFDGRELLEKIEEGFKK